MYIFGIVVPDDDETPAGRASAALKRQLPTRFPEYRFEFFGATELEPASGVEPPAPFHVLAAGMLGADDEVGGDVASHDLVSIVQAAVDGIVAAAKAKSLN
jgi:hypothetical protein